MLYRGKYQRGYALTEVLIASAILALVASVTVGSIVNSLAISKKTQEAEFSLSEARTILARLEAGLPHQELLEGMTLWSISYEAIPLASLPRTQKRPIKVTLSHPSLTSSPLISVIFLTQEELDARVLL